MLHERLSDHTLDELIALINDRTFTPSCSDCHFCGDLCTAGAMPLGAVANDIGILFLQGTSDAEKVLASLLEDDELSEIAYFYLTQRRDHISTETITMLSAFEKDPKNSDGLTAINARLAEIKLMH